MTTRILVVSSVHPPDDPRIRHKLVESLTGSAEVVLAVRSPGPSGGGDFERALLRGGRVRRTLEASLLLLRGGYDVASVHDPELLPAAIVSGVLGRRVVFDLHEDLPAQLAAKPWMPRPLRPVATAVARGVLRLAEATIEVTLAEERYGERFGKPHVVFPNHLAEITVPVVPPQERAGAVYLGDVTEARGLPLAVEALGHTAARPSLTLIGRCAPALRNRLEAIAGVAGITLVFEGFQPPDVALPIVARHAVAVSPLTDHPNYRHSLPTKLLEYLAVGVPVVASDLPGSRRVARDLAGIIWVPPGDPEALADGVELALGSSELTEVTMAGADEVRTRFRWPAEEVRRFYIGS